MQNEEPIEIRLLGEVDIAAALRLKELAHWNQTEDDWRRLLRLEPNGCFCATVQGRVVGTTTTTTYGRDLAWIGMVLVDPDYRRLGIATRMMHVALDYLREAGVRAVKLDATPDGRPVYENFGFKVESLIERWEGVAGTQTVGCSTLDTSARREALTLDRRVFGADRSKLIEMLVEDAHVPPLGARSPDDGLAGYVMTRRGTADTYIGPLVAIAPDAATLLLDGMCSQLTGQRVYVDLNTGFETGREVLTARGFVKQRDLIRMCYGEKSEAGTSSSIFAIAGPEYG